MAFSVLLWHSCLHTVTEFTTIPGLVERNHKGLNSTVNAGSEAHLLTSHIKLLFVFLSWSWNISLIICHLQFIKFSLLPFSTLKFSTQIGFLLTGVFPKSCWNASKSNPSLKATIGRLMEGFMVIDITRGYTYIKPRIGIYLPET